MDAWLLEVVVVKKSLSLESHCSRNINLSGSPFKISVVNVDARPGILTYHVHELLECPVCMNLMYPPIHKQYNSDDAFLLAFEAFVPGMAPVYMTFLWFMGDDCDARKFRYSLEVGGNNRKLTWQGIPRSICDSHREVCDSRDGLIIHRNLALFLSGGDGQKLKL
ncbi:hypothetical protein Nepgr_014663 [Nepenthes gracilis]|uniref:Seven-in-absentia protein TRAF-like domain-containing protein n=1 Tax=Nepenthes gracilis TaxID=150966 RepID=A0AAD3XPP7_NEPGR|nr:hypothetical protein Nepgr_014663 [Nepenthes gracilis]